MKILNNKVNAVVKYGRITIETKLGVLEYSYQTGGEFDENYQIEKGVEIEKQLTDNDRNKIDDIITKEIRNGDAHKADLIEALNHIDELADIGAEEDEKSDLQKSYSFLFDFLKKL